MLSGKINAIYSNLRVNLLNLSRSRKCSALGIAALLQSRKTSHVSNWHRRWYWCLCWCCCWCWRYPCNCYYLQRYFVYQQPGFPCELRDLTLFPEEQVWCWCPFRLRTGKNADNSISNSIIKILATTIYYLILKFIFLII